MMTEDARYNCQVEFTLARIKVLKSWATQYGACTLKIPLGQRLTVCQFRCYVPERNEHRMVVKL
jgi:hypothetical protein